MPLSATAVISRLPPLEPPADFADPRLQGAFQPQHWPLCNGEPPPSPNPPTLHERRCLEFLSAFYHLNVLNARLLDGRTQGGPDEGARTLLGEIAAATAELERLEDRYAPIGFFGEPVMEGVFYRDITFVRPELPRILPGTGSHSSHIAVPGIEEIPESELQGPVKIIRFAHGKMDI
jgi:hypothetical protein